VAIVAALILAASLTLAHDTWVQTNSHIVRAGDVVFIDLMLGNHGNEHRDFKLAGKASPHEGTFEVIGPDGARTDLKSAAIDMGYTAKEGYWSATFETEKPGLYTVVQTSDKVVDYAPKRSIKSAKTFFVASTSMDHVPVDNPGFDTAFGHPLELVPQVHPVTPMGPGMEMRVQLLYKGKPLPNARVSFIPRGHTLSTGLDDSYERMTDADGMASLELKEANYYLIVAHHEDAAEKGDGYESTKYSATLTVLVPAICPCCGE
jgi:uncharacterized GH25 family protein